MEWGSFKKVQTKCYGHETEVMAKTVGEFKNNSLLKSSLNKVWKSFLNLLEKRGYLHKRTQVLKKKKVHGHSFWENSVCSVFRIKGIRRSIV